MRNILSFFILLIGIWLISSCEKKGSKISSTPSQLWFKVSNDMPDFNLEFICKDVRNNLKSYAVTYNNNVFSPNLRTVSDNINNETWVMVFKSLDKTDVITIKLSGESNTFLAKGFGYGEKRFMEVSRKSGGGINVTDRDITTIINIVWFD